MFEVELKFKLSPAEERRLLAGAILVEQQEFIDIYYDNSTYSLSTNDIWLRTRNEKFVLKLPMPTTNASLLKQKNTPKLEVENIDDILHHLNIKPQNDIHQDLANHGITALYQFKNIRKKYKKEDFTIDIDKAIFEDFTYETCEIELVVLSEKDIDAATKKIEDFALQHGIKICHVEGRLIEYIKRKNPLHYEKLL